VNGSGGPSNERFTIWGGALVVVAGILMLLDRGGASVMLDPGYVFVFWGTIARIATAIALCAGFVGVAFGRRRGTHLTGSSRGGPWLLTLFGSVLALDTIILVATRGATAVGWVLLEVVQIAAAVGGLWAARAVYRARVADKSTRVLLVAATTISAVFTLLEMIPSQGALAAANTVAFLFALSLIALGVSVVIDGKRARVRSRIELIRERW
jgi:hypothetical protein